MLGKTHLAIGVIGAVVAAPSLLHMQWETLPHMISHATLTHFPPPRSTVFTRECEFVAATAVGSIVPDFDEQHSLMARDAEKLVRIAMPILLLALIALLRLETSIVAWMVGGLVCLGLLVRANVARRLALAALGGGMLYLGLLHNLPPVSGGVFALWCLVAMFARHRTWTHSAFGWATFTYAITRMMSHYGLSIVGTGVALGYALHIIADMVSGGVDLFWPFSLLLRSGKKSSTRIGIHLVKTGSPADKAIGTLAMFAFIALVFV